VLVSTIGNIPASILADRWSRKYMLMIGIVALSVGSLLMSQAHSLASYLSATAIWGIYVVATSGTYQAITYDALAEIGKQSDYVLHQGRSYGMFLLGISLSSVASGYLAHAYGFRSTYLLTLIPCAINLLVLGSIIEPRMHRDSTDSKLFQHLKHTVRLISGEQVLLYLSLVFIIAGILDNSQNEYSGLYFIALGFGAVGNGWANAGKWLFGSLGQFLSNRLRRITRLLIPTFLIAFIGFSLVHSAYGLIFFYAATFSRGIVSTNVENVIQQHTASSVRATTISLLGFIESVVLIPLSLLFGLLANRTIFDGYRLIALVGLAGGVIWLLKPKRIRSAITFESRRAHAVPE
jgi:MFS family permease